MVDIDIEDRREKVVEDDGDEDVLDGLEGRNGPGQDGKEKGSITRTDGTQTSTTNV